MYERTNFMCTHNVPQCTYNEKKCENGKDQEKGKFFWLILYWYYIKKTMRVLS